MLYCLKYCVICVRAWFKSVCVGFDVSKWRIDEQPFSWFGFWKWLISLSYHFIIIFLILTLTNYLGFYYLSEAYYNEDLMDYSSLSPSDPKLQLILRLERKKRWEEDGRLWDCEIIRRREESDYERDRIDYWFMFFLLQLQIPCQTINGKMLFIW